MNKTKITIIASVCVAIGIFVYVVFTPLYSEKENKKELLFRENQILEKKISAWEAQTETRGAVEVSVQPENLSDSENSEWTFAVSFDTHSEELNDDVANISVLRDENGKEYAPREWRGDPLGGHHRGGILSFPSIVPRPNSVSIAIKRIGEESERLFTWDIKGR